MKKTLKIEIDNLAEKILITSKLNDAEKLHILARKLYEKTAVLQFFNTQVEPEKIVSTSTPNVTINKNVISALDEDLFVSNETVDSDFLEPATEKMIDIVAQIGDDTGQVDQLVKEIVEAPVFAKNDKEDVTPETKKSLNDHLKKGITIGLNDRIAFVKHLFNGSTEDFNRVISQLNTLGSELEALEFLNQMVKPEYDNWDGKEAYEERFLSFIEGKY